VSAVESEIWIDAPIERVYAVVTDYAAYPEFVPGVRACTPGEVVGGVRRVAYDVDLGVRRAQYVLGHREERPVGVSWSLVSGDAFARSDGAWRLTGAKGGTRALYRLDVELKRLPLVPRAVVDRVVEELTRVQLPRTLKAFKERAEGLA
jgi:ribosome-associated toxin RatA of RatAB toxin-antitoxin module